ncbi:hypothetical protein QBC47DRAFT_416023 [Echria macrotheca]|uniref:Uncharacterized protein n=1 Tax=Echria macrotheca TaxID=438768 RepID=A0AAJ0BCJ5_9PEZI|nr:hypothetical protein QBC47DRAFT_416023 [Echria macrotheca]
MADSSGNNASVVDIRQDLVDYLVQHNSNFELTYLAPNNHRAKYYHDLHLSASTFLNSILARPTPIEKDAQPPVASPARKKQGLRVCIAESARSRRVGMRKTRRKRSKRSRKASRSVPTDLQYIWYLFVDSNATRPNAPQHESEHKNLDGMLLIWPREHSPVQWSAALSALSRQAITYIAKIPVMALAEDDGYVDVRLLSAICTGFRMYLLTLEAAQFRRQLRYLASQKKGPLGRLASDAEVFLSLLDDADENSPRDLSAIRRRSSLDDADSDCSSDTDSISSLDIGQSRKDDPEQVESEETTESERVNREEISQWPLQAALSDVLDANDSAIKAAESLRATARAMIRLAASVATSSTTGSTILPGCFTTVLNSVLEGIVADLLVVVDRTTRDLELLQDKIPRSISSFLVEGRGDGGSDPSLPALAATSIDDASGPSQDITPVIQTRKGCDEAHEKLYDRRAACEEMRYTYSEWSRTARDMYFAYHIITGRLGREWTLETHLRTAAARRRKARQQRKRWGVFSRRSIFLIGGW